MSEKITGGMKDFYLECRAIGQEVVTDAEFNALVGVGWLMGGRKAKARLFNLLKLNV